MTHVEALDVIRHSRFAPYLDYLKTLLMPAMQMHVTRTTPASLALGESRLGGTPDVPAAFDWPRNAQGAPLAFLAQIKLAEVQPANPEHLLPDDGWLCFFYDTENQPWGLRGREYLGWRVLHFVEPPDRLQRAITSLKKGAPPLAVCRVRWEMRYTLPCQGVYDEDFRAPFVMNVGGDNRVEGKPRVPFDWWWQDLAPLTVVTAPGVSNHHLFGHPQEVQMSMPPEFPGAVENQPERVEQNPFTAGKLRVKAERRDDCPDWLVRLLREGADWRLLLQLDSDEDGPGWMWGDAGLLYFWMTELDLRTRAYDRVWLNLQCS